MSSNRLQDTVTDL